MNSINKIRHITTANSILWTSVLLEVRDTKKDIASGL